MCGSPWPPIGAVDLRIGPAPYAPFTLGGLETTVAGEVCDIGGAPIGGLFAAGNAMGGVTGRAYGGAGGTIGPAMVFGYRAGYAAATGKSVD